LGYNARVMRLEVGDQANFVFPYNNDSFLKEDFSQIGVADGFGRVHWCSRPDFRKARDKYKRDFAGLDLPKLSKQP
jgi:hypothetical protein